jgi:hypothetical protein
MTHATDLTGIGLVDLTSAGGAASGSYTRTTVHSLTKAWSISSDTKAMPRGPVLLHETRPMLYTGVGMQVVARLEDYRRRTAPWTTCLASAA